MARFGGTDPALLAERGDDREGMAGGEEGVDEFVEEDGFKTVVVGDEEAHALVTKAWPATGRDAAQKVRVRSDD